MKLPGGKHHCLVYCTSCESMIQLSSNTTCKCKQSQAEVVHNKIKITGNSCFIIAIDTTELRANILNAEYDRINKIKRKSGYGLDAVIVGPENEVIYKGQ